MNKIPWWKPQIGKTEYRLLKQVLESNFINEGTLTLQFQKEIEQLLGVKHVIAVTSATSAIFLALKSLNIGYGDEVIVPDLTFISTANAVEMTGATPILADIDPTNLTLDPVSFEKAITKRTKAVIPVHVSGRGGNLSMIQHIAKEKNIFVVEDAAEGFMSKYQGKYLGTIGLLGCFSLSPAKTITTGQGGLIATNSTKLYEKLVELKDQGRPKRGTGGDDIHMSVGYNFKFTDLQAAVGLGQLGYLDARLKRMRKNYEIYQNLLSSIPSIKVFDFNLQEGEIPQWIDATSLQRNELDAFLSKNGIDCRRFWHPIHKQKPYKQKDSLFPNSTKMSRQSFWLPSAFTLTDSDIKKVCTNIKLFLLKKS